MFHRWAALVLVLALWAMSPKNAAGQISKTPPRGPGARVVGYPYPNPFNPEIHIPFAVGDSNCTDGSLQHRVTVQIRNVLAQVVAIPVLESATPFGSPSLSATPGGQTPVNNLQLGCGIYTAFWSGKLPGTGKEAPSGTYMVVVLVDGTITYTTRIFNRK